MRFPGAVLQQQGAGGVALSYSFLQSAADTSNTTTYTFSSQNIGTAASDRSIVVLAVCRGVNTTTSCSMTIAGQSATVDLFAGSGSNDYIAVGRASVPTGTTGNIVVTWSAGQLRCAYAAWRVTGGSLALDDSATATGFGTTATDLVVTSSDNGLIVAGHTTPNSAATTVWSGATEVVDEQIGGEASAWSAADVASTSPSDTVTVTITNAGVSVVAAAVAYRGA